MVTHTIDFVGNNKAVKNIYVNGKLQPLQNVSSDTKRITYQTEQEITNIVIYETHQYSGKGWFWWWLICYFISFFGIFDVKQNRHCLVTYLKFTIDEKTDSYTIVKFNDIKESNRVAEISTSCQLTEIANEQYYDQKAKKIRKGMNWLKFFLNTTFLVLIVLYFVNK